MDEQKQEVSTVDNSALNLAGEGVSVIASMATEVGVGLILTAATGKALEGHELKPIEKICSALATAVISGVVANACEKYISNKVNQATNTISKIAGFFKELRDDSEKEE